MNYVPTCTSSTTQSGGGSFKNTKPIGEIANETPSSYLRGHGIECGQCALDPNVAGLH